MEEIALIARNLNVIGKTKPKAFTATGAKVAVERRANAD
jgi:hypothetical protein